MGVVFQGELGGSTSTPTFQTTAPVAAGDTLVCAVEFGGKAGGSAVVTKAADNAGKGTTWTVDQTKAQSSNQSVSIIRCACPNGLPAGTVVSLTPSVTLAGTTNNAALALDVSGLLSPVSLDVFSTNGVGAGITPDTGSATTTGAHGDYCFAGFALQGATVSGNVLAGSGWTLAGTVSGSSRSLAVETLTQSSAGTADATLVAGSGYSFPASCEVLCCYALAAPVSSSPPQNTAAPVCSGGHTPPQVGDALSCTAGSWTGTPTPTEAYQWQHYTGSAWVSASGAGAATSGYTVDSTDVGFALRCQVKASNSAGTATAWSNQTQAVVANAGGGGIRGTSVKGLPIPIVGAYWGADDTNSLFNQTGGIETAAFLGRKMAIRNAHFYWGNKFPSTFFAAACADPQIIPMVTWGSQGNSFPVYPGVGAPSSNTQTVNGHTGMARITAGEFDAVLKAALDPIAAANQPVILRPWQEMNIPAMNCYGGYQGGITGAGQANYIAAFNYLHDYIQAHYPGNQIVLVWCPTAYDPNGNKLSYEPAAAKYDIGGLDLYRQTFDGHVDDAYNLAVTRGKPFMICEGGVNETKNGNPVTYTDPVTGAKYSKSGAIPGTSPVETETRNSMKSAKYAANTIAYVIWHWNAGADTDNLVNTSAGALAAYRAWVTDSYFDIFQNSGTAVAPSNTALPTISDTTPTQGELLTCANGSWNGVPTPGFTYQWLQGSTPIAGATSQTYTPVSGDVGHTLSCKVTATNPSGSASATSAATASVASATGVPVNTSAPVASPTGPVVGTVMSCNPGTWTNTPITQWSYEWFALIAGVETSLGAAQVTSGFTVTAAQEGYPIRCWVNAKNATGWALSSVPSEWTAPVPSFSAPANTVLPALAPSGGLVVGQVVTCDGGSWSGSPTSFAFQWYSRTPQGTVTAIPGATSSSYTPTLADTPNQIACQVTASNPAGSATATSAYTSVSAAQGWHVEFGWQRGAGIFTIGASQIGGTDVFGGLFSPPLWTDSTPDVSAAQIARGRADIVSQIQAGTCDLSLIDPTGKYDVKNPSSPLAGLLDVNVPARVYYVLPPASPTKIGGGSSEAGGKAFSLPLQAAAPTGSTVIVIIGGNLPISATFPTLTDTQNNVYELDGGLIGSGSTCCVVLSAQMFAALTTGDHLKLVMPAAVTRLCWTILMVPAQVVLGGDEAATSYSTAQAGVSTGPTQPLASASELCVAGFAVNEGTAGLTFTPTAPLQLIDTQRAE